MIDLDWMLLGWGVLVGAFAGAVYFAGLAWGMKIALRTGRPTPVLLLSGALRIGALLGAGWGVSGLGATAIAGFALAFLLMRTGVMAVARHPVSDGATLWN